ncbi:unnamed protein product [Aphanomyces euteiches]
MVSMGYKLAKFNGHFSKIFPSAKMNFANVLLLALVAIAQASITLTTCTTSKGVSVPCLNDTATGNLTNLEPSSNQTYDFRNLNISAIQNLPADAQWVDLSNNQITQVLRGIPSNLTFLNLSHNALKTSWINVSIPVVTLDVSYNQGGLAWTPSNTWENFFPKVVRLLHRGNQLKSVSWNQDEWPIFHSVFRALDLSENPGMVVKAYETVTIFINTSVTLTADANSYEDTLKACGNKADRVVQYNITPVVSYSVQGDAVYGKPSPNQTFSVCKVTLGDLMGNSDPTTAAPSSGAASRNVHGVLIAFVSFAALDFGH